MLVLSLPPLSLSPLPSATWRRQVLAAAIVASLSAGLAGCAGSQNTQSVPFQREDFDSSTTYSRSIAASATKTCEAARRALLSQGYVVTAINPETVNARKSFQPSSENHIEIEFRVVCTTEAKGSGTTLAFVSALQDRYALKKSNNSASVGVGAFGSVSLPFSSSDDSLVKVASETISVASFYDRFFRLLTRYLNNDTDEPTPSPSALLVPLPMSLPSPGSVLGPQPAASAAPAVPAPAAGTLQALPAALPASAPAAAAPLSAPSPAASSAGPTARPASASSGGEPR